MPHPLRRPPAPQRGVPVLTAEAPAPFSTATAAGMVVVGVLCFAAFIVVFALARGPGARDGGAHALSRSAIGFAGLAELLPDAGTPVVVSRATQLKDTPPSGVLILTPPPGTAPPKGVGGLVPADVALLVLPKWRTATLDDHPGWVEARGVLPDATVLKSLPPGTTARLAHRPGTAIPALFATKDFAGTMRTGPVDGLQVLDGTTLRPLLRDTFGGVVLGTDGDSLYVLSDPDLLNNKGLATAEGADGAVTLLHTLADGGTVAFDLSLDGLGHAHDPLRAIFEPPLLGATLCAAAAALLVGLLSAVRFGPALRARRSFDLGKAALAANSAALIARAGREPRMATPYAALVRTTAARALRLPRLLGPEADATLDRLARQRSPGAEPLPILLAAADAVRDRAGLLAVARRLHTWQKDLVRADR